MTCQLLCPHKAILFCLFSVGVVQLCVCERESVLFVKEMSAALSQSQLDAQLSRFVTEICPVNESGLAEILRAGANPNLQDKDGRGALHNLALAGKWSYLMTVLQNSKSLDVSLKDNEGFTPLHQAVIHQVRAAAVYK